MKIFGKNPSKARQAFFADKSSYKIDRFQNQLDEPLINVSTLEIIKGYFNRPKNIIPNGLVPSLKTNLKTMTCDKPTVVWFGHSSYLIKHKNISVLVDPVFCGYSSPFSFYAKAFKGSNNYQVRDLPLIDYLVISHDHYDHLDYETMVKLKDLVKQVITPLGLGSHLEYWGWETSKIIELDWEEKFVSSDSSVTLIATTAMHSSGRGLATCKTLWTSYVLELDGNKIFLGGDSGYGPHFSEIGEKYGPFDLAILENGQYNLMWHHVHLLPHECIMAAKDLKASMLFPIHWGKFCLAYHPWNEPIKKIWQEAKINKIQLTSPMIGEPYTIGSEPKDKIWWDFD
ncbi:MBL fold metallo-hydrolase [Pedobacter sp. MR22-3]|uniref:MBL fold metallo-hydrolase n=1 Tax=Pedobacter sp. MR22-3 TaxID=2994552 RepID=UPI002247E601|nr:MBL fold metallo-hydrolase [Pedobacter sp. MR22-3]MCX2584430.1 MBL fold metallo-hydrolase [Pedobacter sp. MR22-3]